MKRGDHERLHELAGQLYAEELGKAGRAAIPYAWSRDDRRGRVVIVCEFRRDAERALAALTREFTRLGD